MLRMPRSHKPRELFFFVQSYGLWFPSYPVGFRPLYQDPSAEDLREVVIASGLRLALAARDRATRSFSSHMPFSRLLWSAGQFGCVLSSGRPYCHSGKFYSSTDVVWGATLSCAFQLFQAPKKLETAETLVA